MGSFFSRGRQKRPEKDLSGHPDQAVLMYHMGAWMLFVGGVNGQIDAISDGDAALIDEWNANVEEAWLTCVDHYGEAMATEMRERFFAELKGLTARSTGLDRTLLKASVIPPIADCPRCRDRLQSH